MWINQARQALDCLPVNAGESSSEGRPRRDTDDSATAVAPEDRPVTLTASPSTVRHSMGSGVVPLTFQAPGQ